MSEHVRDHENDSAQYWRGETNARLKAVENIVNAISNTVNDNRRETGIQIEALRTEFNASRLEMNRMLYKIVGIGLCIGAVVTFLLNRLFPMVKP